MEIITPTRPLADPRREYEYLLQWADELIASELPILQFTPWSKQRDAMRADKPWRLLAWANRTGKTTTGAHEVVLPLMGWHRYIRYPDPPMTGWVCSVDYKQMRDSIMPALAGDGTHPRMLPAPTTYNQRDMSYTLPHPSRYCPRPGMTREDMHRPGSILRLKSADSGRQSFQGAALPIIWLDEELPEAIIREMVMRLPPGYTPRIIWTMTAVEGLSYAYDHIYVPYMAWCDEHPGREHPTIYYSEASMYEAPHLTDEQIESLAGAFVPGSKELEVRTQGGFRDLAGDSVFSARAIDYHRANCRQPAERVHLEYAPQLGQRPGTVPVRVRPAEPTDDWEVLVWQRPLRAYHYCLGADCMEGKLSDPNNDESPRDWGTALVYNRDTHEIVAASRNRLHPTDHGKLLWLLAWWYNRAWLGWEVNSAGVAVTGVLTGRSGYPPYTRLYQRWQGFDEWSPDIAGDDLGWRTAVNTRGVLIRGLIDYLDYDRQTGAEPICRIYWDKIVEEMIAFQRDKHGKIQHIRGRHDDLLFGLGVAYQCDMSCPGGNVPVIARQAGGQAGGRRYNSAVVIGGVRGPVCRSGGPVRRQRRR